MGLYFSTETWTFWIFFAVLVCAPMLWLGVAFGMASVREPRKSLHHRLRWSWIAAMGLVSGVLLAPIIYALSEVASGRAKSDFLTDTVRDVVFTAGPPFVAFAVVPAILLALISRFLALRTGYWCRSCGYDLRGGTPTMCPECGTAVDPNKRAHAGMGRLVRKVAVRGSIAIGALVFAGGVGLVVYDCAIRPPVVSERRMCDKCGAVESCQHSKTLHFPLGWKRNFTFAKSAACAHDWTDGIATDEIPMTPSLERAHVLLTSGGGSAIIFALPSSGDPDNPQAMTYGCLELPLEPSPDLLRTYTIRWRRGPGLLTAGDAKHAQIKLLDSTTGNAYSGRDEYRGRLPTGIQGCEPPERLQEVCDLLNWMPQQLTPDDSYQVTGGRYRTPAIIPWVRERDRKVVEIWRTTPPWDFTRTGLGGHSFSPALGGAEAIMLAGVSAEDWKGIRETPAPWPAHPMTRDAFEQYGPLVRQVGQAQALLGEGVDASSDEP